MSKQFSGLAAAQRREARTPCHIRTLSEYIGDHWIILVVMQLTTGPKSYSDLIAGVADISLRSMTRSLRTLERNGLISTCGPGRARYRLTPLGRTMIAPLKSMTIWAKYHHPLIAQARSSFDGMTRH